MSETQESRSGETILDRIVDAKRKEIEIRCALTSLGKLREQAKYAPPARDFYSAVTAPGRVRLIAEIKKASPSKGLIRDDFDPEAIARSYAEGGADALSVLTDEPFFQGSIGIFQKVRAAVDLPLLRKDFMIDPYQFFEARVIGADAVLLITSILTSIQLREFYDLATSLGMAVLVETHSSNDLNRAISDLNPRLLGINNRDLHHPAMQTDLGHTARMLPMACAMVQDGRTPSFVSESGIYTAEDVAYLKSLGVSAVLVGESLMRKPDPGEAARELMSKA